MKKKFVKLSYFLRLILFLCHPLILFSILNSIIRVGIIGYIFLSIDIIYIIKIISELFSKDKCYKDDVYYNIMQIGLFIYMIIFWIKVKFDNMIFIPGFLVYLKNNYVLLSLLMLFLIFYTKFVVNKKK